MSVLTSDQVLVVTGRKAGGIGELSVLIKKLDKFQREITSQSHVKKINALIPAAEKEAAGAVLKERNIGLKSGVYNRVFHSSMNKAAKEAGLRS